jgi:hypothetical protein
MPGVHDRCTTRPGPGFQVLTFLARYLVGWRVLATFVVSRIRERRHARAEDA